MTDFAVNTIIVADMTNLQNRGLVNSLMASPFILNAFIAGYITEGISAFSENGWRWGVSQQIWGLGSQLTDSTGCSSSSFLSVSLPLWLCSSGQTAKPGALEVSLPLILLN